MLNLTGNKQHLKYKYTVVILTRLGHQAST
jgi:hypothetical protein